MLGIEDEAEALATDASEQSGLDDRPNADPAVMAVCYCGLRLVPHSSKAARLVGDQLFYPRGAAPTERAFLQAHEVGHDLVRHAGWKLPPAVEEIAASRIGCAIILPRRAFLRDVREGGADIRELLRLWPLASPWIVARRLCELVEGAAAAQFSPCGKVRRRIGDGARFSEAVSIDGALLAVTLSA